MRTIWKYQLDRSMPDEVGIVKINIPAGAQFLTVHEQDGGVYMWALVDGEHPLMPYEFYVTGTGWTLPEGCQITNYLGTAHVPPFVWHVFGPL